MSLSLSLYVYIYIYYTTYIYTYIYMYIYIHTYIHTYTIYNGLCQGGSGGRPEPASARSAQASRCARPVPDHPSL